MLLNELSGYKKYQDLNTGELISLVASQAKQLGNGLGNFAYVFKHPTKDEVVKFWIHDPKA